MFIKNCMILIVLMLVLENSAMDGNALAKALQGNLLQEAEELLKNGHIDPNGTTIHGTPYISFIMTKEAIDLMYRYGLHQDTLARCVDKFLKNNTLTVQDHTAAVLIAGGDDHALTIPATTRKELIRRFKSMNSINKNHRRSKRTFEAETLIFYCIAAQYLDELEIKEKKEQ